MALDEQEKAFVIAAIDIKLQNDKKERKRLENIRAKGV